MGLTIHPKRRHLYLLVESTAGTWMTSASVFVVANSTVPHESLKFMPTVEFTERDLDGASLQKIAAPSGSQSGAMSFSTRLIAPATKGVAGPLSPLFKALGLSETLVAGTSATYVEDPNSMTTLSVGWGIMREDGSIEVEHGIAGARVRKLDIKATGGGKLFMCDWELYGKIAYESTAPVAIDDATPNNGITYVDDNAAGFKFLGVTARTNLLARDISTFEFSVGRTVELGVDIGDKTGYDYAHIGGTDPTLKIDPTKVSIATASDLANMISGGMSAASLTATAPNGATFTWSTPNLQPISLSDDARGSATSVWGIQAKCRRSQTGLAVDASNAWQIVFA